MNSFNSIILSLRLGITVSVILVIIILPLAVLFSFKKFHGKIILEALFSLPAVLPPVVLGFYLLQIISPKSIFGGFINNIISIRLAFSFTGIVIASIVACFPFMFSQVTASFRDMDRGLIETAWSMGKSPLTVFFKVIIPDQFLTIISSVISCFAQVLGSFGIIVMVGGNIKGETDVVSIRLFEMVEALDYKSANELSMVLLLISFAVLILLHFINHRKINNKVLAEKGIR